MFGKNAKLVIVMLLMFGNNRVVVEDKVSDLDPKVVDTILKYKQHATKDLSDAYLQSKSCILAEKFLMSKLKPVV